MVQPISASSVQPFLDQLNKFQEKRGSITNLFIRKTNHGLMLEEKTIFSSMRKVIYKSQYDPTINIEAVAALLDQEDVQPQQKEQIKTLINNVAESLIKSYIDQAARSMSSVVRRMFVPTSRLVEKLNKIISIMMKIDSQQEGVNEAKKTFAFLPGYPFCNDCFSQLIEESNLDGSFVVSDFIYNDLSEYLKNLEAVEHILASFGELESKLESFPESSTSDVRLKSLQKIKEMYLLALNESLKCVVAASSWKSIQIMRGVNDQAQEFIRRMQGRMGK